ncbi:L-serine dehydratase [Psychromonas sp. CNPT3]|uniref:L-serine ammonia-lyase n=1 Tax=Psychromonas sp. CNPT3 TaxID=314282 RepID=UPI00006EA028|nr:L-serine ammonia-lyase [Psychromonas sp. CNPT3]AGH80376.1 L-serine dehydratase [Psychromonas sp. CNPT3]
MLSIFDIYKIGIGPSSSHTNGPMIAGYQFTQLITDKLTHIERLQVDLYGSLSLTGKGHHTDKAIILGLVGFQPENIKSNTANKIFNDCKTEKTLSLLGKKEITFDPELCIIFHTESLPLHENGMSISAFDKEDNLLEKEVYYSIGGGFIKTEAQMTDKNSAQSVKLAFPFTSADSLLTLADTAGLSIGTLIQRNELSYRSAEEIEAKTEKIWKVISLCLERGLKTEGVLEGGLNVIRRAPALLKNLQSNANISNDPMEILDWINLYAFAISEENAAGGQVVTSPTNGAAGVIPAVMMYYNQFIQELSKAQRRDFLAVSAAIGMLYKVNASISGAEVGCQGEIGVSASMAAAGLTAIRGGTNEQICIAAEIAMEHSLGMTCDPIGGLVQIPCIERNAMGALKAINASRMALKRNSKSLISLDKVIETMYRTGKDMNRKYRETSLGGLAMIHLAPPCE